MSQFRLQKTNGIDWFRDNISCLRACPVDTEAYKYVVALGDKDVETAYDTARKPNPFVHVCGQICGHPCESACRRGDIDEPISIRALKRTATELHDNARGHSPGLTQSPKRQDRVAVIGSGPAGLTCAHDLARLGYPVTVFEASEKAGGMLTLAIPEYRLSRAVIQMEIAEILKLGVDIQYQRALGRDFTLSDLKRRGFQAVFLSVGAHHGKDLQLEGRELDGVMQGIDFLLNVNLGYRVWLGHKVLVIGGGDVAIDVARTASREGLDQTEVNTTLDAARAARRLGTRDVQIVYRKSRELMPASREEIEEAEREGIAFHTNLVPQHIVGVDGRVTGLETIRCQWHRDENGRWRATEIPDSQAVITADTIVFAIGQTSDLSFLQDQDGVDTTQWGTIKVDEETMATTSPGVYAGGDCAFGPRLIIDAEAEGQKAARSIHEYLQGNAKRARQVELPIVELRDTLDGYDSVPRQSCPSMPIDRRTGFTEVEHAYSLEQAALEANRCLHCHENIFLDAERCILCGGCVDVCPYNCVSMIPAAEIEWDEAGEDVTEATSRADGYAMVLDETECIRCGLCVRRCPTDAIVMRVFQLQEAWRYD